MHVAEQLKVGYYCLFLFIVYVAAKMKISTSLEKAQCVWPGALRTDKTFRRNVTFEQITEGHNQVDHRYLCRKKKKSILRDRRMPLTHRWPTCLSSLVLKITLRQI